MKKFAAVSFALVLPFAALSTASADDTEELKNECRQVGEQHGIGSERMPEWIDRCLENIRRVQREREGHGGHGEQGQRGNPHQEGGRPQGDHGHGR